MSKVRVLVPPPHNGAFWKYMWLAIVQSTPRLVTCRRPYAGAISHRYVAMQRTSCFQPCHPREQNATGSKAIRTGPAPCLKPLRAEAQPLSHLANLQAVELRLGNSTSTRRYTDMTRTLFGDVPYALVRSANVDERQSIRFELSPPQKSITPGLTWVYRQVLAPRSSELYPRRRRRTSYTVGAILGVRAIWLDCQPRLVCKFRTGDRRAVIVSIEATRFDYGLLLRSVDYCRTSGKKGNLLLRTPGRENGLDLSVAIILALLPWAIITPIL